MDGRGLYSGMSGVWPKRPFCKQNVTIQRRCGHSEEVRCKRAFELAQNPSRCQEAVVMTNPECGHNCSTTCYGEKRFDADNLEPLESVHEGDASNYHNYGLSLQCSQEFTYVRRCGHSKKMKCSEARHMTSGCQEIVMTKIPTCMHVMHRPWKKRTKSIKLLNDERVVAETLGMPSGACPPALKSIFKYCQAPVRFRRTVSCGRDFKMTCYDPLNILHIINI
ncbi:hypothetical protein PsorP6_015932 [Peronosclerospora sorghi]|uniref:Uncharacterized protein n=1 Tax=Peronosclerospora sorghi TaxID=230839 RepID=A0ACC0WLY3_9STRA|nr:hypothetical protein PsorP6_015932 [Peronosclerospora sorghi]